MNNLLEQIHDINLPRFFLGDPAEVSFSIDQPGCLVSVLKGYAGGEAGEDRFRDGSSELELMITGSVMNPLLNLQNRYKFIGLPEGRGNPG
jgi:hypothetical protein